MKWVGLCIGVLLSLCFILSIASLISFIVINCLNYLFPVLQIPIDFWGICSMIVLLVIFNQPKFIKQYGKNKDV
tara:strand:+ start:462 stop:683 length:222 start_codon:yes stop_codon:yes gene_type:complete